MRPDVLLKKHENDYQNNDRIRTRAYRRGDYPCDSSQQEDRRLLGGLLCTAGHRFSDFHPEFRLLL